MTVREITLSNKPILRARRISIAKMHIARRSAIYRASIGRRFSFVSRFASKMRDGVLLVKNAACSLVKKACAFALGLDLRRTAKHAGEKMRLFGNKAGVFSRSCRKNRIAAAVVVVAVTLSILSMNYMSLGLEVFINGESVGYVKEQSDFEDVANYVEKRASALLGTPYQLEDEVSYKFAFINNDKVISPVDMQKKLFDGIDKIAVLYVLTVDGKIVGANESKLALEALLDGILDNYKSEDGAYSVEYLQDIKITEQMISRDYEKSIDEISDIMLSDITCSKTHIVESGQTLKAIADEYGTTVSEIQALNPEITPSSLKAGEEVLVSKALSFISVKQTRTITYSEEIPYETKTQSTDELYKNTKRVVTKGEEGEAQIVADVVYVDGVETERTIIEHIVLKEPTTEVVQIGTKNPPPTVATGSFKWPFWGTITSRFGYRGRGFHTGLDIAGPKGSAIVAADGGTVTFSGWKGGYGNCLIIDHGNGKQTLYGHCSSLIVSSGTKVAKGQMIARVGSTGNSTGPHLHFEVIINGKQVNPISYLP